MPSAHSVLVIVTALIFIAAGAVLGQIGRLLHPSYATRQTARLGWRCLIWFGGLCLLARAWTLLFPGEVVAVERMTPMVTFSGLVVLGLALWKLDDVMRENDPPPWSVQLIRLAMLVGVKPLVAGTALAVPPAAVGDEPPPDHPEPHQRERTAMMIAAALVIAGVVAFVVLNSPAAAAG